MPSSYQTSNKHVNDSIQDDFSFQLYLTASPAPDATSSSSGSSPVPTSNPTEAPTEIQVQASAPDAVPDPARSNSTRTFQKAFVTKSSDLQRETKKAKPIIAVTRNSRSCLHPAMSSSLTTSKRAFPSTRTASFSPKKAKLSKNTTATKSRFVAQRRRSSLQLRSKRNDLAKTINATTIITTEIETLFTTVDSCFATLSLPITMTDSAITAITATAAAATTADPGSVSIIVVLPVEIHANVLSKIESALDLFHVSQACSVYRELVDHKVWTRLFMKLNPSWSKGMDFGLQQKLLPYHLHLQEHWLSVRTFARYMLEDYWRRNRFLVGPSLEEVYEGNENDDDFEFLDVENIQENYDMLEDIRTLFQNDENAVEDIAMQGPENDITRHQEEDTKMTVSRTPSSSPRFILPTSLNYEDLPSFTTSLRHSYFWRNQFYPQRNWLVINPLLGQEIKSVNEDISDGLHQHHHRQQPLWVNEGPLVSHTDSKYGSTLVCYIQKSTLPTTALTQGSDVPPPPSPQAQHQIAIFKRSKHLVPCAIVPEAHWSPLTGSQYRIEDNVARLLKVAQIMDMKHYPDQRDTQGRLRVMLVLAFGQGSADLPVHPGMAGGVGAAAAHNNASGPQDINLLDIWVLVKVVEIFVKDAPCPPGSVPETPRLGRTETTVLNIHDPFRGRAAQLYSVPIGSPEQPLMEDRLALIGIRQYSEPGQANVILMKCPLFQPAAIIVPPTTTQTSSSVNGESSVAIATTQARPQSKWICHILATHGMGGLEATCMTLFPSSGGNTGTFDRLVAILDRHGRGEVWDYIKVRRIAILSIRDIHSPPSIPPSISSSTAITKSTNNNKNFESRSSPLLIPRRNLDGSPLTPIQQLRQTSHHLQQRRNRRSGLHYWGMHASYAMEFPTSPTSQDQEQEERERVAFQNGNVRLVAMADGTENQWESTWWHIDERILARHLERLEEFNPTTTSTPGVKTSRRIPPLEIKSSNRHFEYQTLGRTILHRPPPSTQSKSTPTSSQEMEYYHPVIGRSTNVVFINAFLVWDHYRIMLTSEHGLVIVDMDREPNGDIIQPLKLSNGKETEHQEQPQEAEEEAEMEESSLEADPVFNDNASSATASSPSTSPPVLEDDSMPTVWITLFEKAQENPVTDISTVGDSLLVSRKYSHLLYPFRRLVAQVSSSTSLSNLSSSLLSQLSSA